MPVKIEKLVFGGEGMGKLNDHIVFAYNALPQEEVGFRIVKRKKAYTHAIADRIIQPSVYRIAPKEDHFLSCSPWQILAYEQELFWKVEIAKEVFHKIAHMDIPFHIIDVNQPYEYRNKMEFGFTQDENDHLSLAFFQRGKHKKVAIKGCCLAHSHINVVSSVIVDWLISQNVRADQLKSLIVKSNKKGEVIASLFCTQKVSFSQYPSHAYLKGFSIHYSDAKTPASVVTQTLHTQGDQKIQEEIGDKVFVHDIESFFQINIALFEKTIEKMKEYISEKETEILDYYAGVGSIGILLSDKAQQVICVENNQRSHELTLENISLNQALHVQGIHALSQDMISYMHENQIVILDPPRAGLHARLIQSIKEKKPKKILYLSCNISTQARDISLLKDVYEIEDAMLFNYFPRTPHVESLCVLHCLNAFK